MTSHDQSEPLKLTNPFDSYFSLGYGKKTTVERVLYTQEISGFVAVLARIRESGQPVPSLERHSNSNRNGGSSVFLW